VQEMVYLKVIKKSHEWAFLCLEPSIKNRIWKNEGGGFSTAGSACEGYLLQ